MAGRQRDGCGHDQLGDIAGGQSKADIAAEPNGGGERALASEHAGSFVSADRQAKVGDSHHISQPLASVRQPGGSGIRSTMLGCSSLFLAILESICAAAVALSGARVLLGMSSLIAAGAAGPALGFHREAIRVPVLCASAIMALLNLLLLWNENRIRRNPAAQWRLQPLTQKQRRQRFIQLATSIGALLLILAEVVSHPWFHHEL